VYPGGPLRMAWHLDRHQESFYSRQKMAIFLQAHAPARIRSFHQLDLPLYIVATGLLSGHPFVFGKDPEDNIIEAILASTAIPPSFHHYPTVAGCLSMEVSPPKSLSAWPSRRVPRRSMHWISIGKAREMVGIGMHGKSPHYP
jgi:hypothetical protein